MKPQAAQQTAASVVETARSLLNEITVSEKQVVREPSTDGLLRKEIHELHGAVYELAKEVRRLSETRRDLSVCAECGRPECSYPNRCSESQYRARRYDGVPRMYPFDPRNPW